MSNKTIFFISLIIFAIFSLKAEGQCSVYDKGSGNCAKGCGHCFNPGARPGRICQGSSTGYFCASDDPAAGSDMAFACMDWTFGSTAMRKQESEFSSRTGQKVYFGVGTYGTSDDIQRGLGACYRLQVEGVDRDLLVQSINTGSDVDGNQFDLQIGDGGAGAFNTCAGSGSSMYPGDYSAWGHVYGGVDNRAQCQNLPPYPKQPNPMKEAGDDLITLCEYSFDKNVRIEGGGNPTILSIARVQCPEELIQMTQIQRNDDPSGYEARESSKFLKATHKCNAGAPGADLSWCLTRMMDCRKPSGAFKDNVHDSLMVAGRKIVQPCFSDGYTRMDVQCGCFDCYC